MSNGFVHSIRVPRLYKTTATTVKKVVEEGSSLKQLIYEKKHPNLKGVYGLAATTIQHGAELNEIIRKTQLLFKEPRLDPWLARVLITELIWGKQSIKSEAKPIQTIIGYENELREALKTIDVTSKPATLFQSKARKPRYVRVNTLIKDVDDAIHEFQNDGYSFLPPSKNYEEYLATLLSLGEWTFIQDFHIPELFAFPPGTAFYNHPGYESGAIVLQDKASCLPAFLLNPEPNSTVLDMCAAPGMKTTHLAAILQNKGKVFSVERDHRRYQTLCEQVKGTNAYCVKTINADAMTLDENQCPNVEYILVDPSCSGSGMERHDFQGAQDKCAPARLKSLQSFQVLLLRHALSRFSTVKRVVYSTCSIYPEENEMVVDEVLSDVGEAYKLVPIKTLLNDKWKHFSSIDFKCQDNCLYAKPEVDLCNGFFVAVFERNLDVPMPEPRIRNRGKKKNDGGESNENIENSKNVGDKPEENEKIKHKKNGDQLKVDADSSSNDIKTTKQSPSNEDLQVSNSKEKRKKKKKQLALESDDVAKPAEMNIEIASNVEEKNGDLDEDRKARKEKKRKRKNKESDNVETNNVADESMGIPIDAKLEASVSLNKDDSEVSPKKKKRKKNKKLETVSESIVCENSTEIDVDNNTSSAKKKRKKKNKVSSSEVET